MKTVSILPFGIKSGDDARLSAIIDVCRRLSYNVAMSPSLALPRDKEGITLCNEVPHEAKLVISVGGDGSVLYAAHKAFAAGIPVLGINTGTVGYLAQLSYDETPRLAEILSDGFVTEERMMLDAEITVGGELWRTLEPALNDFVISKASPSNIAPISLYSRDGIGADACDAGKFDADGVVFATPTGSTAYSMSAGGPIIDPSMSCICVSPICPHSVMARPAVYSASSVIECMAGDWRRAELDLVRDGTECIRLPDGAVVRITQSERKTRLVRVKESGFTGIFRQKMTGR